MSDDLSRRDLLKAAGLAGAAPLLESVSGAAAPGQSPILPLTSSGDVFIPPKGNGFQKFSFDFPEPSVEFSYLRFSFRIYTRENVYGLDQALIRVERDGDGIAIHCTGFVWAGGQEKAAGSLAARIHRTGDSVNDRVTWDATVRMDQPIKSVAAVIRGIPRGKIGVAGSRPNDTHDDEVLIGYPFGAGDLFGGNTAWSMATPLAVVQPSDSEFIAISSLDVRVRAKRLYFQPGEHGYRVEAIHEVEGWLNHNQVQVPDWQIVRAPTLEAAVKPHYDHLESAFRIPRWEQRDDVPDWLRRTALVVSLHGMHYTGFVFNDFARMLEILRTVSAEIPGERVLVFLPAWDGRYYWDYPAYRASDRLGGEAGLKRLVDEGHRMGFRFMPMFGANAANRHQPSWPRIQDAASDLIDGNRYDLTWVDWDNDRHQEGWLSYMNLGVDSWRQWLGERIGDCVERYGMDAWFLDISAGWINNPRADMHEGMRRLVADLRRRFPRVPVCGEFHYDALLSFIPFYHVYSPRAVPYARFFSHLSPPAPGRGSSGVHESGFGAFDPQTLSLARRDGLIPTLSVVDDTFTTYRDQALAVIRTAREWAT
ncbi:MAG TPA: hypothetical protein VGI92_13150 [Gemmatimonadales bacterium]